MLVTGKTLVLWVRGGTGAVKPEGQRTEATAADATAMMNPMRNRALSAIGTRIEPMRVNTTHLVSATRLTGGRSRISPVALRPRVTAGLPLSTSVSWLGHSRTRGRTLPLSLQRAKEGKSSGG